MSNKSSQKTKKKLSGNSLFKEADEKWHAGYFERREKYSEQYSRLNRELGPLYDQFDKARTKYKEMKKNMERLHSDFRSNEKKLGKKYKRNWYLYNPDPKMRQIADEVP